MSWSERYPGIPALVFLLCYSSIASPVSALPAVTSHHICLSCCISHERNSQDLAVRSRDASRRAQTHKRRKSVVLTKSWSELLLFWRWSLFLPRRPKHITRGGVINDTAVLDLNHEPLFIHDFATECRTGTTHGLLPETALVHVGGCVCVGGGAHTRALLPLQRSQKATADGSGC